MLVGRFVKRASGRGGALRRAAFIQSIWEEGAVPYSRELILERLRRLDELARKGALTWEEQNEVDRILSERVRLFDPIISVTGLAGAEAEARVEGGGVVRLRLPPVARLLDLPREMMLSKLVLHHGWLSPWSVDLRGYAEFPSSEVTEVEATLTAETPMRELLKFLLILSAAKKAGLNVMDDFLKELRKEDERLARYLERAWVVAAVFELME